ncbi:MAG: hypothetical protein ACJ77K_10265 [Bacteroidia bacterium]
MNSSTPREVLNKFYIDNHLDDDGGNSKSFVRIDAAKNFHFYIPNSDLRRKAVALHDVHHILSGYNTSFKGECEISAWEIGSGIGKYWIALYIDTAGMMMGLPLYFKSVLRAYARGRRTKNLYSDQPAIDKALDMKISELQAEFRLNEFPYETKIKFGDVIALAGFSLFGLIVSLFSIAMIPFLIIYSIYIGLFVDKHPSQLE